VHSSGFVGTITAVSVTLNITHTYDADLRITLITPWNRAIQLVFHRGGSGQNFTNTILSDQAAAPIGAGTAPFNGTYRPEQPLAWVNGGSADGDWVLQVADTGPGNTGTLDGWSITFSTSEPTAQTDANGKYLLTGLPPGKYIVREVVPPGQVQTTADPPVLNVSAGQTISNVNFGTYQPSAVRSHLTQAAGATSDHSGDQRLSPSASSIFVTGPNRSPTLQNHLAAKKREHSLDETFSDRALDIFFASVELRIDELVTLGGTAR
jgi:subtilisin-like proprotein convertase family protein